MVQKLKPSCGLWKIIVQTRSVKPIRPSYASRFLTVMFYHIVDIPTTVSMHTLPVNRVKGFIEL